MAFKKIILFQLLALVIISSSCSNSIHKQMISHPASLNYLLDEPAPVIKNEKSIYLEVDTTFGYYMPRGEVKLQSWYMIPLIFYWQFTSRFVANIDTAGIQESPVAFLHEGFLREAERNCVYNFTTDEASADYVLVLRLDSLQSFTSIKATQRTIVIPLGLYNLHLNFYDQKLNAGQALCHISYDLYGGDKRKLISKSFGTSKKIPDFEDMGISIPYYNRHVSTNAAMVKGLSESYRHNFKEIIDDLNSFETPTTRRDQELHELIMD